MRRPELFSNGPRQILWSLCVLWLVVSCRGPQPLPPKATVPASGIITAAEPKSGPHEGATEPNSNLRLAEIPAGSLGPRMQVGPEGTVIVWAVTTGDEPGFYSLVARPDGSKSMPTRVSRVDPSARQLSLGRTKEGQLVVLTVHKSADQDVISATRLGPEGRLQSGPHILGTTPSTILYSQALPTALGSLILWVERAEDSADLYSVALDDKGPRRSVRIVRGITAWQVSQLDESIAVITREGTGSASIVLRQLGARGETIGAPLELARDVVGGKDLDFAMTRDEILVAWSEEGARDSHLVGTLLDASGNVLKTPFSLTAPGGEQALLAVESDPSEGSFQVMWQEPLLSRHGLPSVHGGSFDRQRGEVRSEWQVTSAGKDALLPLFAPSAGGTAVLTDVECDPSQRSCSTSYLRGALLIPKDGQPPRGKEIVVGEGRPAAMAWDLTCTKTLCQYLASDDATPARVVLGRVDPSTVTWMGRRSSRDYPRLESHETLGEVPELSKLEGAAVGGRPLLAWVSYFQPDLPYIVPDKPAPDGRRAPVRARLTTVIAADAPGGAVSETVVSYRARSLGGVHLVAPVDGEGLLVWAALDNQQPQVFATVVDGQGKKLRQKMLTKSSGEVTDVAAVRVNDGYVVAWVEGQGERPEVHAVRLNHALAAVGPPRAVSSGALSPSGVTLLATEESVLCVWSDARASGGANTGDLYWTALDAKTARQAEPQRKLTSGAGHDHSPHLFAAPSGETWVAWISQGDSRAAAGLRAAPLSRQGKFASEGRAWAAPGDVRDYSVDCSQKSTCSAVVVLSVGASEEVPMVSLWGMGQITEEASASKMVRILPLWTGNAAGVSPALVGDSVFFADHDASGAGWLLRRAQVKWDNAPPRAN